MFMKAKEVLIRKFAFSKLPVHLAESFDLFSRVPYKKVMEKVVSEDLMTQAAMKAFGSYKVNFQIRQMIWS